MRNQILSALYNLTSSNKIETQIIKELRNAKQDIYCKIHQKYIPFFWCESSIYTTRDRYTKIRNLIKDTRIAKAKKELLLRDIFILDTKLYDVLAEVSSKKENEKVNTEFSIDNYFATIKKIKKIIEEKDFKIQNGQTEKSVLANLSMFYLAFVTGRRFFEIIKTLNIIKKGGKIYFDGLAKKKDETGIKLGLLLDDDYIFMKKALKYVRNHYTDLVKDLNSKQINAKYAKNITRALRRILENNDISFHDIREMYAEVVDKEFN